MSYAPFRPSLLESDILPPSTSPQIHFYQGEKERCQSVARTLFPTNTCPVEWAALTGAGSEAIVEMGVYRHGLLMDYYDIDNRLYQGVCRVFRLRTLLVLRIESLFVRRSSRGQRIGRTLFTRQVEAAFRLGFDRIVTIAGRRNGENGYYTWPRFGFNRRLPVAIVQRLPSPLYGCEDLLDLLETPFGRYWWRRHGQTISVVFDLSRSSRSLRVFFGYLTAEPGKNLQKRADTESFGKF